jgi:bacterioferritin (cytochrome b1)
MTPEERQEMNRLCEIIQQEKNHAKFMQAIQKLIELIGAKEHRIDPTSKDYEGPK